ncbi:MAG: hypothetical protein ACLUI0_15770 [Blautia massiliensis (ex Durand et al. 2017)]
MSRLMESRNLLLRMARQKKKPAQVPQSVWNGLNYKVSNGEVTILSVVYDQHF